MMGIRAKKDIGLGQAKQNVQRERVKPDRTNSSQTYSNSPEMANFISKAGPSNISLKQKGTSDIDGEETG